MGKLGMAIKFEERYAIVNDVIKDNAVDLWNEQPDQQHKISKGDCIMKANSVEIHTEQEFRDNVGTDPVELLIRKNCEEAIMKTTTTTTRWSSDRKNDPDEDAAHEKVKTNTARTGELKKKLKALHDTKLAYASLL